MEAATFFAESKVEKEKEQQSEKDSSPELGGKFARVGHDGQKCLIPPRKISHNTGGKNFSSRKHKTVKNTTAYNNKGKHNSAGAGKRSSNNKSKSTKKGHKL